MRTAGNDLGLGGPRGLGGRRKPSDTSVGQEEDVYEPTKEELEPWVEEE